MTPENDVLYPVLKSLSLCCKSYIRLINSHTNRCYILNKKYFQYYRRRLKRRLYLVIYMPSIICKCRIKNAQNDTGIARPLEQHKTQTFRELLMQLASSSSPYPYIHKLQTRTRIDKEHGQFEPTDKGKDQSQIPHRESKPGSGVTPTLSTTFILMAQ
jgi:hypothetical protein